MKQKICPVCFAMLHDGYQPWHYFCAACGYEKSNFLSSINHDVSHCRVDEAGRASGLEELRTKNFLKLLKIITGIKPNGGCLLEVGSAHGWFLNLAKENFKVLGIEPDQTVYEISSHFCIPVRKGFFPEALGKHELFDIIVFNDVIEHIPDIEFVLSACSQHLNQDGLLVLNLPSSDGFFYKISKIFMRFGKNSFFERLWQKDLPSPHVHYFNSSNLNHLLVQNNFFQIFSGSFPSLYLKGLHKRISHVSTVSLFSGLVIYLTLLLLFPLLPILPKDIICVVAKKMQ